MNRRIRSLTLGLAALALMAPTAAQAQRRRPPPPQEEGQGWTPISGGLRLGYESSSSSLVLGAGLRVPVLPGAQIELLPNADVTFLPRLKEYEYNLEAVYVYGGRRGGLYAGGGLAWRNTVFPNRPGRRTKQGYSAVVGLHTMPSDRSRFGTQIELRWIFVDSQLKPRVFSIGVNFPLW